MTKTVDGLTMELNIGFFDGDGVLMIVSTETAGQRLTEACVLDSLTDRAEVEAAQHRLVAKLLDRAKEVHEMEDIPSLIE
jgi:hypothetical protein